jgi:release factor glutamine methyltransferase
VSEAEWEWLAPELRDYEPRAALIAGPTGLEAIASLLESIARSSASIGVVALEVGEGQAEAVRRLMGQAGFGEVETRRDLAGIERAVLCR